MTKDELKLLLRSFKKGSVSEEHLISRVRSLASESIGFATVDHHRALRQGFPEVILCQGKTPAQVAEISKRIVARHQPLLATRASKEHFLAVKKSVPKASYNSVARTISANTPKPSSKGKGTVLVVTAGTSDMPVAEEAAATVRMFGHSVELLCDVGVAGIHRLLSKSALLHQARVIIVVAGMEGALPSVVGGLVDVPVIAVPTSTGYGTSFQGIAALLAMLNSCASGITVVNIDNGFGAGFAACMMNR